MARNRNSASTSTPVVAPSDTDSNEENIVSTEIEAPEAVAVEAPVEASTEVPTEKAEKAEVVVDLTDFQKAVEAAIEQKDETTGVLASAVIEPVIVEYRKLSGIKAKNAAKKSVDEQMTSSMNETDFPTARSLMLIGQHLVAGAAAAGPKAEKVPTDPTEAFVQRAGGLRLAMNLIASDVPEGVNEEWKDKVTELVAAQVESATAYLAWLKSDTETRGDEPEVLPFVKAAAKLALGKSARVGGVVKVVSTYTGERREIGKHIIEAFEGVEDGTFLKIAEIRKFVSSEYGENAPSAGAISARLFPKSGGPTTVVGVVSDTDAKGNKGATKVAVEAAV